VHRESKENLAATNVSRLNRTRSGVSGESMFREESDLVQQAANLHRPVAEGAIRGMNDYGRAASGAKRPVGAMSAPGGIVLQKSKVARLKIFRENAKQRAIADSYDLNRVTEVSCEFCVTP